MRDRSSGVSEDNISSDGELRERAWMGSQTVCSESVKVREQSLLL